MVKLSPSQWRALRCLSRAWALRTLLPACHPFSLRVLIREGLVQSGWADEGEMLRLTAKGAEMRGLG